MGDNDYTPSTEDVRDLWKWQFYEGIADDEAVKDAGWDDDRIYAQFDRWLAGHVAAVRSAAWDEGFNTGYDKVLVENATRMSGIDYRVNPHRGAFAREEI